MKPKIQNTKLKISTNPNRNFATFVGVTKNHDKNAKIH